MKLLYWYVCASLFLFTACKKEDARSHTAVKPGNVQLPFVNTDQIPNEIIPLLYHDLLKDKLYKQAEDLATSYYSTLSLRKDNKTDLLRADGAGRQEIAAASLPSHNVPNIGVVMDGNWVTTSGVTSSHIQNQGWVDISFNAMNGTAPDAGSNTAPGSTQILGTTGLGRKMEAFKLPFVQFAATDNTTGITYYTGSFGFSYTAHVQNIGWQNYVSSSSQAGTTGQGLKIESVKIYGPGLNNSSYLLTFNDPAPSTQARLYIYYRVHQQVDGWRPWVTEDAEAGVTGLGRQVEALQVRAYLVKV